MAGNVSNDQNTVTAQLGMVDAIAAIKSTIAGVQESVNAARPGFVGAAGTAAGRAADAWEEEASRLNTILNNLQTRVGTANDDFINMDEVNSEDLTRLTQAGVPLTNLS